MHTNQCMLTSPCYTHTHTHTHTEVLNHANTFTFIPTHTEIHTYKYTHTHTHTHTNNQTEKNISVVHFTTNFSIHTPHSIAALMHITASSLMLRRASCRE